MYAHAPSHAPLLTAHTSTDVLSYGSLFDPWCWGVTFYAIVVARTNNADSRDCCEKKSSILACGSCVSRFRQCNHKKMKKNL